MNKKKIIKLIVLIYFLLVILFISLDYFNVLSFITTRLNSDYFSTYLNTLTTIVLFILSYLLINKKINDSENDKKQNKETSLFIMLNETYNACTELLEFFCDDKTLIKYIVPKVDFNSANDSFLEFQMNRVFKYDIKILEMVSDGIVNKSTLKQYLDIKNDIHSFIHLKVTLFDVNSPDYKDNPKVYYAKKELDSLETKLKKNLKSASQIVSNKIGE